MLNWTTNQNQMSTQHCATTPDTTEQQVRESIEGTAEKAIQMLTENIQDHSLYFLCEWNPKDAELNICVTDASKSHDSPHSYRCKLSGLATALAQASEKEIQDYAGMVKFWLHDYLSSYAPFFKYSLVAIFHSSTREQTELL